MKPNTSIRYAVFLILLVLGQEFCAARYVAPKISKSLRIVDHKVEKREAKEDDKALAVRPRQKRSIGVVVLAITLTMSIASLTFEIYNKIEGCCGMFPAACRYRDETLKIKDRLKVETKVVDKIALNAVNRKEDVIQANYKLQEMWNEMKRIGDYQEQIIKTLAPSVVKDMNNKWARIEQQLKNKNSTVAGWSYLDVDTQFISYLDNVETAMIGLSSFLGYGLTVMSAVAFKYYKANVLNKNIMRLSTGESYRQMVNARHTKSAKLLGVSDVGINNFIKETATARVNSRFGGNKYANVINGINVVASAIIIGFEIYATIQKVEQCKDRERKVHESLMEIRRADLKMKEAKKNATDYYNLVDKKGWQFITGQLTNSNFHQTLLGLKYLAQNVSTKTAGINDAITRIGNFLQNINGSVTDPTKTRDLQIDLIKGLGNIKFFLRCIVEKGKLLNLVSEQCKNGTNSLINLYNEGTKSFGVNRDGCLIDDKGTPYTTFQNAKSVLTSRAKTEGYNIDCILNNLDKKDKACRLKRDGYKNETIARDMQLTLAQVQYFIKDCPEPELTPAQKQNICTWRSFKMTDEVIVTFLPGVKLSTVKAYKCRTPTSPAK